MKNRNNTYTPEILGMDWWSGSLILVGAGPLEHKSLYVLGNIIVHGTKEEIPVALFAPRGNRYRIMRSLMRMQVGGKVFDFGQFSSNDFKDFPVYIDDSSHLTIASLVSQIFRLVEDKGVQAVIIDHLQDIDGSLLDKRTKEKELNAVLRLLKAMAESLEIVIVITAELSEYAHKEHRLPMIRDILDVSEAEEHCDQIILLKSLWFPHSEKYKMILPLGLPCQNKKDGLVLNVILDTDKHYFKKATVPFEEEDCGYEDTPLYQWYPGNCKGDWNFEFLDSEGFAWLLTVEQHIDENDTYYQIAAHGRPDEEIVLDEIIDIDDIELIKAIALEKARERFPEVDIPDKSKE